jgi:aspartate/methionine/tyrosine aminotransferase
LTKAWPSSLTPPRRHSSVADHANLIVLRSLSLAYGLAGARVGAALGQRETLARLAAVLEPYALPEVSVRLALQALDPSRLIETKNACPPCVASASGWARPCRVRWSSNPASGRC